MRHDPPTTPTVDVVDDYHGTPIADPYRWLEDLDDAAVAAWVAEQNRASEAWLDQTPSLRQDLVTRMRELIDWPRRSAPSRRGARWLWLANDGLQDQDVLVTADAPDGEPRPLVDPNALSEDGTVALAGASVSHDGERLAYALSSAGSDWMTWHVREVATGEDHPEALSWAKFSGAAWLPDGEAFCYGRFAAPAEGEEHEAANQGHQIWLHRVGTPQADDVLVHHAPDDPRLVLSPQVTDDGRWLVLTGSRGTERVNGVWLADLAGLDDPAQHPEELAAAVRPLLADFDALWGVVDSEGEELLVVTDLEAERRRVLAVDTADPARRRELVAQDPVDTLVDVARVGDRLLVRWLHHARSRLTRHRLDGSPEGEVALPGLGTVGAISGTREDRQAHLTFAGFTQPASLHRLDVDTGERTEVWRPALAFDPERLTTEQVGVPSTDGTTVPAFVVRRGDLDLEAGDHPTLVWGYGGFMVPVTPMFSAWWLAWVERGGVLVVPSLRGGGEYGTAWHHQGKREHKQQVFDDAIAVIDWLVAQGWTRYPRVAITGRSNGGLLAGAVLTQAPERLGAALPEVGVLDMLRFHRFTIGWAWASDYGTSEDPEELRWLLGYSPLHAVRPGTPYPPTLVMTGDTDDRVVPAHSYKFAAALQAATPDEAGPIMLRVETRAGHGAGKPTSVVIEERADALTFLLRALGAAPDAEAASPGA